MPADPMRPAGPAGPVQQPGGLPAAQGCDGEREDWYAWGPDAEGSDPWDGDPPDRDLRRGADNWDPDNWDPEDGNPEDCERAGRDLHLDADDHDPDAGGPPAGSVFAQGRWGDELAPDPVLATLLDLTGREGLEYLDDDQLTGVLQAAARLASWSASLKIAATSRLAARREADGRKSGDWRPFDHVDDEVAVALTLTRRSAARLLDLALSLDRLPLTRAALAAGLIDERRAEVIAEELLRPRRRARRRRGETHHRQSTRADQRATPRPGPPRGPVRRPQSRPRAERKSTARRPGRDVPRDRRHRRAVRPRPAPRRRAGR